MATLVLTALGSAIGGAVGGSIGAIIGQRVDQEILKPKARKGPRLTDLSLQTSIYGTAIPRLYGRMRVAGSVIWATDLIESKTKSSGKGQASTIQYSYSASFAVALSCRRISAIKRIWADGSMLRGEDGKFRTATIMRVHHGDGDQAADPLIASAVGIDRAPAHHGLAYVVFQDFALADYGNRIPSMTFEVEADPASDTPDVGTIIRDLAPGISADAGFAATGYGASGTSAQAAIAPLADAWGLSLFGDSIATTGPERTLTRFVAPDMAIQSLTMDRASRHRQPQSVMLRHYDPARDFQVGAQSASVIGNPDATSTARSRRIEQIELPIALTAETASTLAQHRALRLAQSGQTARVQLGPYGYALRPGDRINLGAAHGPWRISSVEYGASGVAIILLPVPPNIPAIAIADPGQNLPSPAPDMGETRLILADLPAVYAANMAAPSSASGATISAGYHAAIAGTTLGWRSATVQMRAAEGAPLNLLGQSSGASALGIAETALPPASPWLEDHASSVIIALAGPHMDLNDATGTMLYYGANLAMIGAEIIQFARAEPLGDSRYRLSHLLRGRWGSDSEITLHVAGEAFLLLDGTGLVPLSGSKSGGFGASSAITSGAAVQAQSVADGDTITATVPAASRATVPISPVHPRWHWHLGSLELRWTRRSRSGFDWIDHVDAPLGENAEGYRITIANNLGVSISSESQAPAVTLSAAQLQGVLANTQAPLTIDVQQVGTYGVSPPAPFEVPQPA